MPFNIGAPELIILLVLALIIFGPGKLPDVGQALGKTVREFRHAQNELDLTKDVTPAQPAAKVDTAASEVSATTESPSAGS